MLEKDALPDAYYRQGILPTKREEGLSVSSREGVPVTLNHEEAAERSQFSAVPLSD